MSPLAGNSLSRPTVRDSEASSFQIIGGPVAVAFTLTIGIGLSDADTVSSAALVDASGSYSHRTVEWRATIAEIPDEYAAEYALLRPIPVEFDRVHGNIVACFREARLSFAGVDQQDAQDHLLDWILGTYDSLIDKDPNTLGAIPAHQLNVLKRHVRHA